MKASSLHLPAALSALLAVAGCSTHAPEMPAVVMPMSGESVVLARQEPAYLAFAPMSNEPVRVRNTYLDDLPATVHYQPGEDYIFDSQTGSIRRTKDSSIPDYSTNILFGKNDFNHTLFHGFGNGPFFVYIDYAVKIWPAWPVVPPQINYLPRTLQKLRDGKKVTIVAFGDSITAGGEASEPDLVYWRRWADQLQAEHPAAKIEAINGATGGDTTENGLARLNDKVLRQNPDVVLIAFGMNDHNIHGLGVPVETFAKNLGVMIDRIRASTQAEVILVSTFPPNPKWHFGSHRMETYALATERAAREKQCAYADVYHNWVTLAAKKKPEDLLGNNINHPNDFGHWIYFQVLCQLGL